MLSDFPTHQETLTTFYIVSLLVLIFSYLIYRKSFSKKRLDAVRNRVPAKTTSEQIIVAWEIDGLLVELSDRKKQGFSKLDVESKGLFYAVEKVKEMFGMGVYYRLNTSVKNMKTLLQSLADNPKVKLFLYTTLNLKVAEVILERLHLINFFHVENRRSSSDCYNEPLKHPTEVDYNTKRVIILTGTREDHLEEDSQYFLVLKKKELSESVKSLSKIITKNGDIDDFHNQIGDMKALVESDYENYE